MRARAHVPTADRRCVVTPMVSVTGYASILPPESALTDRELARANAPVWALCALIAALVALGAALGAWPLVSLLPVVAALACAATRREPASTVLVRCDLFFYSDGAYATLTSEEGSRARLTSTMIAREGSQIEVNGRELVLISPLNPFECLAPSARELRVTLFSDSEADAARAALEAWGREGDGAKPYEVNTEYGASMTNRHDRRPRGWAQDVRAETRPAHSDHNPSRGGPIRLR